MKPTFRVNANGVDISSVIGARFISLSVTDEAGFQSDSLELRLDNRDQKVPLPRTGAELEVWLGYENTGVVNKGIYTVDEISEEGFPLTLIIPAKAANMKQSLKQPKTRAWDNVTFGSLVSVIAAEHGLTPSVSPELAGIAIPHIDQTGESDLHFLTRLSLQYDAIAKPVAGHLLFKKRGDALSASQLNMSSTEIGTSDLVGTFSMTAAQRGKYKSIVAQWQDVAAAKLVSETAGQGEPVFTIRQTYPDAAQAQSAAAGKLSAIERGAATLRLTCIGKPELAAEGLLTLSGVSKGSDGDWLITRVVHKISDSGYTCEIDAETPKGIIKPVLK